MNDAEKHFGEKLKFQIDPTGLEHAIKEGKGDCVIVDVRGRNAYKDGHIPGAIDIPIEELSGRMGALPKDKTIYIYCYNIVCFRAPKAAYALAQNGFEHVVEVFGGYEEWQRRGHPVDK